MNRLFWTYFIFFQIFIIILLGLLLSMKSNISNHISNNFVFIGNIKKKQNPKSNIIIYILLGELLIFSFYTYHFVIYYYL